ncbi:aminoglycoside phosphotransferase family protein [Kribbella shirazensis]|uniref:Streptomycin 6-kinase n=1 Tax=Kribbella shirazensis TaxID=1105143 RepID=A0A7X5V5M4_9ACTN|nr:aminoglycoside phosphotransferase family protein [Kribbella shirazensis]NIK55076.1 streptomycin 6-kinase [Kribbella shirazensis]
MIELPDEFLRMPRWWTEGADWLRDLPEAVDRQCARWQLEIVGAVAHGSNAVVVPVRRGGDEFVLRMSPPGAEVAEQSRALRWWAGRGMALLYDADVEAGAMLLERLSTPLTTRPVYEAVAVLGRLMRRLAVPGPDDALSTAEIVARRSAELEPQWSRLGHPFPSAVLREALDVAPALARTSSTFAVNGDFHSDQVLAGTREDWLTVDPVLYRGDIEFDLGRVLWTRLDEMTDIVRYFDSTVSEAGLDRDRARDWVIWRTVDYWLWGLSVGLTEDPVRCARLVSALSR